MKTIPVILLFSALLSGCNPGSHRVPVVHHYTVLERSFSPDTKRTTVAPVFGGKSGVKFAFVSSGSREKFILLVREGHNAAETIEVTAEEYANAVVGSVIERTSEEWILNTDEK